MNTIKIIVDQVTPIASCAVNGVPTFLFGQPSMWAELADSLIQRAKHESWTVHISASFAEVFLLRLTRRVREGVLPLGSLIISVIHRYADGTVSETEQPINGHGQLVKAWPGGFFEQALEEMF